MDMKWVGAAAAAGVGGLVATLFVAARVGAHRWSRESDSMRAALVRQAGGDGAGPLLDAAGLPAPVRRFAEALPAGARPIRSSRVEQEGTFRMGEEDTSWKPFQATETFIAYPAGFVWDAEIRMLPGVRVRVRDTYASGSGTMQAAALGLIPVVDMAGSPELAEGALSRYLAEAVWIPTRLVQGAGLSWSPRDDSAALARLVDGDTAVELLFTFDEGGRVTQIEGMRPREVDGAFVPTRWVGRFSDYRDEEGVPVPTRGEVAWEIDGMLRPYWRGTIGAAEFTY